MARDYANDENILALMYEDNYYPDFLVDKLKDEVLNVVEYLENEIYDEDELLLVFGEMTENMNSLKSDFQEHDSDLESGARESLEETIKYIIEEFGLEIDIDDALDGIDW